MSTANEPTRRMSTRPGNKDRMAKVVERFCTGGIIKDDPSSKRPSGGKTRVVLPNDEGKDPEATQPLTQKKANATGAAKMKPKKKTSRKRSLKVTKEPSASEGFDAAIERAVASRLAELEDMHLKQDKATCSSHPHYQNSKVPEQRTAMAEASVNNTLPTTGRSLGEPVMNSNIGNCGRLNGFNGNSETKDESTQAANKTIEVDNVDGAMGGCLELAAMIISCQWNIVEKKLLNSVNAELRTQEYVKSSQPKPRHVHPQLNDLSIDPQAGGKVTALNAIFQGGAKTTATDEALYQNTTKKQKEPQILATPSGYGDSEDLDNDQHQDLDSTMGDGESSIDMEVMEPTPVKGTKTKAGAKGGQKATVSKLQDNIKVICKEVPNSEIRLTGNVSRDQTFKTPTTKKGITNNIEEWVQALPSPPLKKQKLSAAGFSRSTSSKANSNPMKIAAPALATTKSTTSCAIVIDSTTEVLRKKLALGSKRWAKDLESNGDADEEDMVSNQYEGLGEEEDDTLEQADAASSPVKPSVATQMSKESLTIHCGIIAPVQEKKASKRQGNQQLPDSVLENGKWAMIFIPMFLRYVGSTQKDVWALNPEETPKVLQGIWNVVYKGSAQKKIKHIVKKGGAIQTVSNQRVIEWRSLVGSNGLTVVSDFMSSSEDLKTYGERQKAAEDLLDDRRYMYLRTGEVIEDGVTVVKQSGCYCGPLVVQTVAQFWIDFDGAIEVPAFVEFDEFPYAVLVLSATSGYVTKESHKNARSTKGSSIAKVKGQDGKFTKATNFSKDHWDGISDLHMRDVLVLGPEKLSVLEGEIQNSVNIIRQRKRITLKKCKEEAEQLDKKARGSGHQHQAASSDTDF